MSQNKLHNAHEYRKVMTFYENEMKYNIERFRKGKWRLVTGGHTWEFANGIIVNGEGDNQVAMIRFCGAITVVIGIIGILISIF